VSAPTTTALTVTVPGTPVGQGRLSAVGRGRMIHTNAAKLLPWRESIAVHCRQAMHAAGLLEPLAGPLSLTAVFTLSRPKSAPRRRWAPDGRPDLDHLIRACCDGITQGGAWVDDGQVVGITAAKQYGLPGAQLTIRQLTGPEIA
jgi:Holliday junction resolvase RusA-like endonuclease